MSGIVTLNDITLYKEDIALLEPNQWLNDQVISFSLYGMLDEAIDRQKKLLGGVLIDIVVLDASVVSCLCIQCDDAEERRDFASGLGVTESSHLIVPINDGSGSLICDDSRFQSISSHWSLLYVDVGRREAFHLDSMAPNNCKAALVTAQAVWDMADVEKDTGKIYQILAPCQQNEYDCGVYALLFAEKIMRGLVDRAATIKEGDERNVRTEQEWVTIWIKDIDPHHCSTFRQHQLKVIQTMTGTGP